MAFQNHLIDRVRRDIEFLRDQSILSGPDASIILSKLHAANPVENFSSLSVAPASVPALPNRAPAPPAPPVKKAKALWDYASNQPDDLSFKKGELIEIVAEENEHWFRGRIGGREGLFPSNHIEMMVEEPAPIPSTSNTPSRFTAPPPPNNAAGSYYNSPQQASPYAPPAPQQSYIQPPPSYQNDKQAMQPYYNAGPPAPYQQQSQVYQPPPPQQQMVQQEQKKPGFFKGNLGQTMATSAAGGVGFGAGAAIGSGIINSIF